MKTALNKRVPVIIYVAIYADNRSNNTLATILDESRVSKQSHSDEPAVNRLVRYARKAKFTRMS